MKRKTFGLILGVFLFSLLFFACETEVPTPEGYVNDFAKILSENFRKDLELKLINFEKQTTNEFAVVIVKSLGNFSLEDYSMKLAEKWKVGKKQKDNGIILLIVFEDRKLRLEIGYGLEDKLPDIVCKHILDDKITPLFKQKKYDEGVTAGVDAVIKALADPAKAKEEAEKKARTDTIVFIIMLVVVVILIILTCFLVASTEGGGGTLIGGGSGGGGGGFSFGGGGFGGGGASGGW